MVQLTTTVPFMKRILSYQKGHDFVSNYEVSMMAILTTAAFNSTNVAYRP